MLMHEAHEADEPTPLYVDRYIRGGATNGQPPPETPAAAEVAAMAKAAKGSTAGSLGEAGRPADAGITGKRLVRQKQLSMAEIREAASRLAREKQIPYPQAQRQLIDEMFEASAG
jgi:hypothetical protein